MLPMISVAAGSVMAIASIAAVCDLRSGTIPNWLTLPPTALAPFMYGASLGPSLALQSVAAAALSAVVPYFLFRRGGMGGGDVKLFAALGALAGFDPLIGLRIQVAAFFIAMLFALCALMRKGTMLRTLKNAAAISFNPMLPASWRMPRGAENQTSFRIAGAVFVATMANVAPYLAVDWTAP